MKGMSEEDLKKISVPAVEKILGYRFKQKKFLQEALTHASCNDGSASYQRLEFLGDAILRLALAQFVFCDNPEWLLPEQLTNLRDVNVSNERLACVAVHHKLHPHIRHNDRDFDGRFKKFELEVENEGDQLYGGSDNAPRVLADIVESIAAAIYMDCNYDLKFFWKVFRVLLEPIITLETILQQRHPVAFLNEFCQKQGKELDIEYNMKEITYTVKVDGHFLASGNPRHNAAQKALQELFGYNPLYTATEKGLVVKKVEIEENQLCKKGWCQYRYTQLFSHVGDNDSNFSLTPLDQVSSQWLIFKLLNES